MRAGAEPRRNKVFKELRSSFDSLIVCAFLGIPESYSKKARLSNYFVSRALASPLSPTSNQALSMSAESRTLHYSIAATKSSTLPRAVQEKH